MADWRTISDSEVDPDAPVTSDLMYALRDNAIAIAEGAPGAPVIRDVALGGTVSPNGIDWVARRIVGAGWNGLGQTVMADFVRGATTAVTPGTLVPGSDLRPCATGGNYFGTSLPGTWRLQGYLPSTGGGDTPINKSLWLRVA